MQVLKISNTQNNTFTNTNFGTSANKVNISRSIIKKLDLNIETLVGYKGKKKQPPIPKNVNPEIAKYFKKIGINWKTHIDN